MNLVINLLQIFSFSLLLTGKVIALEVPKLTGPIVDQANLLSIKERTFLESYLRSYKEKSGHQLQVLIIKSLEGDSIERFSIAVTDQWKLGKEESDDGALFLISLEDRLTRIEVGQGLEGSLTDFNTRKILLALKPYFRNQEFGSGIFFVLGEMTKYIDGQIFKGTSSDSGKYRAKKKNKKKDLVVFFLQFFLIGGFILLSRYSRYGGHSYYGGGGFGGGGGSFGGGWSGGGGGFSGGGSSGSW